MRRIAIRFFGRSDVGRRRKTNEDSFYISNEDGFGIVCDGMGGHEGGEIASRMAVEILGEYAAQAIPKLAPSASTPLSRLRARASRLVEEWASTANLAIFRRGGGEAASARTRMGTTLALLFVLEDFAVVAHVGDSRVYRIRDGAMLLLTRDHSILADDRSATPSEAPRKRKYVTRALGTKQQVEVEIRTEDVASGDLFVLCSDGLSDLVLEREIATILERAGSDRRKALRSLIHLANKRGGTDNITVVLGEAHLREDDDEDATEELGDLLGR